MIIDQPNSSDKAIKTVAYVIYALYLGGTVLPMLPIVGIIFSYIFENDAKNDPIMQSHFRFLIRTFWLGVLYFTLASVSIIVLVGFILLPICFIWWLIRLIRGVKSLMRDEAIADPSSWTI